jgi:hypothetical protein
VSPQLQLLPPLRPPLGLYVRPGRNDHVVLQQLIVEGRAPTGLVFEARLGNRHEDLWQTAADAGIDTVLDTNTQELWSVGGRSLSGVMELPWALVAEAADPALRGKAGDELVSRIASYVRQCGFTSVLAPTHYLAGPSDTHFQADVLLARKLRRALDDFGLATTPIYYPLTLPAATLSDSSARDTAVRRLMHLDIDALWLRFHPFGTNASGPVALRRYIAICGDLRRLGVPIVGERTGTVGLALLAFGAVGGIECGVTLGERFDGGRLTRETKGNDPYSHPPMVYLQALGQFADRKVATALFEMRGVRAALGCADASCCRTGPEDTLRNPRRHALVQRLKEVNGIASTPGHRRASEYVETVVRRGSDVAVRLGSVHPAIDKARTRLDSWRGTLSAVLELGGGNRAASPALGGRIRREPPLARPRSI